MASPRRNAALELFAPLHVVVVDGPLGKVWIESDGRSITRVSFDTIRGSQARTPKLLVEAGDQMKAYLLGKRKDFDLPVLRLGTRFQKLVWEQVEGIAFGRTVNYQDIGDRIGGKAIARTVGNACGHNPIAIIVPCHRVIGRDGLLTGYVGGLWRKKWLLQHEGVLPKELFSA